MRTGSALFLLTVALSTASVAAPVIGLPGPRTVSVTPHIVDIGIDASGLAGLPTPMPSGGGLQLLTRPRSVPRFATVALTWRDTSDGPVAAGSSLKINPDGRSVAADLPSGLSVRTGTHRSWTPWRGGVSLTSGDPA